MRLEFLGAAHTVTGSCYLLETGEDRYLIDCGMFQGSKRIREYNYEEFSFNPADIDGVLLRLAEQVGWRLRRAGKKARTIQLKVRRGDFTTWTRSRTLDAPTCYDEDIYEAALSLYCALAPAGGIRLLGISAQNFGAAEELSLFDTERPQKKENLYRAIDGLKQRFGEDIIGHGHT